MDDLLKIWTTVGSAGTLNQADLAKVSLHQSIVQLGVEILPPQTDTEAPAAAAAHRVGLPATHAVVRYNVTPVDGVFFVGQFKYGLQIRYRGKITAKLMEVDIETGAEKQLILFDSASFPGSSDFQVRIVAVKDDSALLDFVNKAYYVEATLTASQVAAGDPAEISIIKLLALADFPG